MAYRVPIHRRVGAEAQTVRRHLEHPRPDGSWIVPEQQAGSWHAAAGELFPGGRRGPADRDAPALPIARLRWRGRAARAAPSHPDHSPGFEPAPQPAGIRDPRRVADLGDRFPGTAPGGRRGDARARVGPSLRRRVSRHPSLARPRVQGDYAASDARGLRPWRCQAERQLSRRLRRCPRAGSVPGATRVQGASPRPARVDPWRVLGPDRRLTTCLLPAIVWAGALLAAQFVVAIVGPHEPGRARRGPE